VDRRMQNRTFTGIYLISFLIVTIAILLILYPQKGLEAAVRGVSIWWDILFPALFPFFVISEMLLGFGIVHFLGTLLDPMMRPVFRIPGIGGFVMAMGFASGYPVGARLTSQLWEQKLVNREEGERLVAFTTSSDPVFLIGAVSVGFFQDASLALILAIAHYGGAVIIGLLMRFHGSRSLAATKQPYPSKGSLWKAAFNSMHTARILDGRPVGILLSQAVQNSLGLIFVVGGLVVFFSVVLEVLTAGHIMGLLNVCIQSALQLTGLSDSLSEAVMKGLFEVTLGAKAAGSAAGGVPLVSKTAIAAFILSWAGISVHAQIASLLSNTNLRYFPFIAARFVHAILSAAIVMLIWQPLQPLRSHLSVFMPEYDAASPLSSFLRLVVPTSMIIFVSTFIVIAALFTMYTFLKFIYRLKDR
jgi:sporulation integral membrane protein YlbJ